MHVDIKSGNAMGQNHFVTPEQFNQSIHCISNLAVSQSLNRVHMKVFIIILNPDTTYIQKDLWWEDIPEGALW